ncbi:aldo/keto reductase [Gordonia sp. PDNC005]|uniref:aldo/keto reductase n=1 Tax=Gordonia sp. PDNC005 TaxID=2811424 RepID=UPI0031F52377
MWVADLGAGRAEAGLGASLERLGLDALYLIHWPAPATDAHLDTWTQLDELGTYRTRAIGVSNFPSEHRGDRRHQHARPRLPDGAGPCRLQG